MNLTLFDNIPKNQPENNKDFFPCLYQVVFALSKSKTLYFISFFSLKVVSELLSENKKMRKNGLPCQLSPSTGFLLNIYLVEKRVPLIFRLKDLYVHGRTTTESSHDEQLTVKCH